MSRNVLKCAAITDSDSQGNRPLQRGMSKEDAELRSQKSCRDLWRRYRSLKSRFEIHKDLFQKPPYILKRNPINERTAPANNNPLDQKHTAADVPNDPLLHATTHSARTAPPRLPAEMPQHVDIRHLAPSRPQDRQPHPDPNPQPSQTSDPNPPPSTRPRSYIPDSEESEDDYDDAPAPGMEKVSANAATQAEPTTSSSPLGTLDELQQAINEDGHARHMQDEEDDESSYEPDEEEAPPVRSSKRTSVVKTRSAKTAATTTTTTVPKAKPAPKTKAKAKPARKISPTESPPPAKRRKTSGATRESKMTIVQRQTAFELYGSCRGRTYAGILGIPLTKSGTLKSVARKLASSGARVPMEAFDI